MEIKSIKYNKIIDYHFKLEAVEISSQWLNSIGIRKCPIFSFLLN